MSEPKILFFDIETMFLKARLWQPGQQYVGHANLVESHNMWDLICIQYCWDDGKPVKVLRYDKHGGTRGMIEKFDELVKKADIIVGKNSDRFDIKMLNSLRMYHGLPGMPDLPLSDDLEKSMRKYFRLPSQSLDYISKMCGIGGKVKMEMGDWIAIDAFRETSKMKDLGMNAKALKVFTKHMYNKTVPEVNKLGKEKLEKMCTYGAKDTEDTRTLWHYLSEHFQPKYNMATHVGEKHACKSCGSIAIKKNGTRVAGKTKYQHYSCTDCGKYAGKGPISNNGVVGKIG